MAYNFNEIKLEKGMYSERGRSFEQTLEALDPNENYKGTPYEGLDAFQRQLKRFDIKRRRQRRCRKILLDLGVGGAVSRVCIAQRKGRHGGGQHPAVHHRHRHPF